MRLHIGAVPELPDYHPSAEGWRAIREPGPLAMQLLGLPLLIVSISVTLVVTEHITISWAGFDAVMRLLALPLQIVSRSEASFVPISEIVSFLVCLLVFGLVIAVHELLHALIHPGNGRSGLIVLGC